MAATCKNCGVTVEDDSRISPDDRLPCPICDSKSRIYTPETEWLLFTGPTANAFTHKAFLGRKSELINLGELLAGSSRTVVIVGPEKSGKTFLVSRFLTSGKDSWEWEWLDLRVFGNVGLSEQSGSQLITPIRLKFSGGDQPNLIILDNVDLIPNGKIKDMLDAIRDFSPYSNIILMSTRPLTTISGIHTIKLKPLPDSLATKNHSQLVFDLEGEDDQLIVTAVKPHIILFSDNIIERLKKYPKDVFKLPPRQFEEVIADLLTNQGCDVELTQETRDGGKDIIASMTTPIGKILTLVEAKRYKQTRPITVGLIRQLQGVLYDHPASHAMLVTTSYFTKDAKDFQQRHAYELSLKEFEDIQLWIAGYKK